MVVIIDCEAHNQDIVGTYFTIRFNVASRAVMRKFSAPKTLSHCQNVPLLLKFGIAG